MPHTNPHLLSAFDGRKKWYEQAKRSLCDVRCDLNQTEYSILWHTARVIISKPQIPVREMTPLAEHDDIHWRQSR